MKDQDDPRGGHARRGTKRAVCAFVWLTFLLGGCSLGQEFRAAAGPAFETGINAILDGLVDGVFAVIEPDGTDGGGNAAGN